MYILLCFFTLIHVGTSYFIVDNSTGLPTIRNGYPRPISPDWPSLGEMERIDAALYVPTTSDDTGHLHLFKVHISSSVRVGLLVIFFTYDRN